MFSRESFVTSCAIKSELVYTTSSLNYTHLQNLTRSLAKKKKVVGTNIYQESMFGKFSLSPRSIIYWNPERTKPCP